MSRDKWKKGKEQIFSRIPSPYDLKVQTSISEFELECYNRLSKEEVKESVTNMYNTIKKLPNFKEKKWRKKDNIFHVVEWLYSFLQKKDIDHFIFDNNYKEISLYEEFALDEEFYGIFIDWIWDVSDIAIQNLLKDIVSLLLIKSNFPTDLNYQTSSNICFLELLQEETEYALEMKEEFSEEDHEQNKEQYEYYKNALTLYLTEIFPLYQELSFKKKPLDVVINDYKRINPKNKTIRSFIDNALIILNSDFDFLKLYINDSEGLDPNVNCCIYWSQKDDYFEIISESIDDYANNVGIKNFLIETINIKEEQIIHGKKYPEVKKALSKLKEITQYLIYEPTTFKEITGKNKS